MNIPMLKDLPPPPAGKEGWPWTVGSPLLPPCTVSGLPWPKISIVTPNYNYGCFLEELIRSVLLQGYPNLEYIVIDDGSTDNSLDIIRKYERWLTYWETGKNCGQAAALNKGFLKTTGDIFAYNDSDNVYMEGCFESIGSLYAKGYEFILGRTLGIDQEGNKLDTFSDDSCLQDFSRAIKFWSDRCLYASQGVFVSRKIAKQAFPLDERLYYHFDYQLWLRVLAQNPKSIHIDKPLAKYRHHGGTKSINFPAQFKAQEIAMVALGEEYRLNSKWKRFVFHLDARDWQLLKLIMCSPMSWQPKDYFRVAMKRPTIIRWSLFWKMLLKRCIGEMKYASLRSFLRL